MSCPCQRLLILEQGQYTPIRESVKLHVYMRIWFAYGQKMYIKPSKKLN